MVFIILTQFVSDTVDLSWLISIVSAPFHSSWLLPWVNSIKSTEEVVLSKGKGVI